MCVFFTVVNFLRFSSVELLFVVLGFLCVCIKRVFSGFSIVLIVVIINIELFNFVRLYCEDGWFLCDRYFCL